MLDILYAIETQAWAMIIFVLISILGHLINHRLLEDSNDSLKDFKELSEEQILIIKEKNKKIHNFYRQVSYYKNRK